MFTAETIKTVRRKIIENSGEIRNTRAVEEPAFGKKKEIFSNRAGCVHRRNKCMQDALRSLGAGEKLGWVEERGGEGREKRWN